MEQELATEKQIKFMKSLKIDIPQGISKTEARLMIDRVLNKSEDKVEVVKIPDPESKSKITRTPEQIINGENVKRAVEIFTSIFSEHQSASHETLTNNMKCAIDLVKQAKEAFK